MKKYVIATFFLYCMPQDLSAMAFGPVETAIVSLLAVACVKEYDDYCDRYYKNSQYAPKFMVSESQTRLQVKDNNFEPVVSDIVADVIAENMSSCSTRIKMQRPSLKKSGSIIFLRPNLKKL